MLTIIVDYSSIEVMTNNIAATTTSSVTLEEDSAQEDGSVEALKQKAQSVSGEARRSEDTAIEYQRKAESGQEQYRDHMQQSMNLMLETQEQMQRGLGKIARGTVSFDKDLMKEGFDDLKQARETAVEGWKHFKKAQKMSINGKMYKRKGKKHTVKSKSLKNESQHLQNEANAKPVDLPADPVVNVGAVGASDTHWDQSAEDIRYLD